MTSKSLIEKITLGQSLVTMFFVAFLWWGDKNAKEAEENGSQNQQIKYLTAQVQELKESFKELSRELHSLMLQKDKDK